MKGRRWTSGISPIQNLQMFIYISTYFAPRLVMECSEMSSTIMIMRHYKSLLYYLQSLNSTCYSKQNIAGGNLISSRWYWVTHQQNSTHDDSRQDYTNKISEFQEAQSLEIIAYTNIHSTKITYMKIISLIVTHELYDSRTNPPDHSNIRRERIKEHPQRSSTSSSSLGNHNKTKNIDRTAAEENPIRSISRARSLSVFVVVFNPKTEHDILAL